MVAATRASQQHFLRWACLFVACSSCTAMRVGCLSQRAMRIRCTARTPLPLCSYETGTLEGEDDADGEEEEEDDDDDGVESVVAYLPQLLEAKYGKDWESLMGAAPEDDEDEDEDEDEGVEARWDFSNGRRAVSRRRSCGGS